MKKNQKIKPFEETKRKDMRRIQSHKNSDERPSDAEFDFDAFAADDFDTGTNDVTKDDFEPYVDSGFADDDGIFDDYDDLDGGRF